MVEELKAKIIETDDELKQIERLNQINLKQNITEEERFKEGYVSWLYPFSLLKEMNDLSPGIIVTKGDTVVGYALTALVEAEKFHPDLANMLHNFKSLSYKNKSLYSYQFYCIGQICVAKDFRGKGVFTMLYQKHKEVYDKKYQLLVTEVAVSNIRSLKAHYKVGFEGIHRYKDHLDEWEVVVWDWRDNENNQSS